MTPGAGIPSVLHAVRTPVVRNALILGISGAFALQALLLIYFFSVGSSPKSDEFNFIPMVTTYVEGGAFWDAPGFKKYGGAMMIFPHMIMLADVELFSWSFVFQMYLGWGFLAASVVLLWLMFRRHDRRLEWLLIPVSAVIFNPLGYGLFLWGHAASLWALTFLGFIACICCLDRVSESRRYLIPAVISGGIISFSSIPGAVIWPVGLVGLLQFSVIGRMPAVIWIASASAALALFAVAYPLWESRAIIKIFGLGGGAESDPGGHAAATGSTIDVLEQAPLSELAVSAGSYVMQIVSNGSTLNSDAAQTALGAAMLVTVLVLPIPYLYSGRIRLRSVMPFMQLLLVSLAFGVMTFIGRGWADPDNSHYILRGNFAAIAFLSVLAVFLIVFLKTRSGRKGVVAGVVPVIGLLVVFAAGIGSSYSVGYHAAAVYSNHQQMHMQCMTDPNNISADTFLCSDAYSLPYVWMRERPFAEYVDVMEDARIGQYRDGHQAPEDERLDHKSWQSMRGDLGVTGGVDDVLMYERGADRYLNARYLDEDVPLGGEFEPDADDVDMAEAVGDSKDRTARIKKSDFDFGGGLLPAVLVYGWIHSNESFSPDGVYLFVGDEIIRRTIYGYADSTNRHDQPYGYRVIADISHLDAGCHDITVRAAHGDRYGEIPVMTLCVDP